MSETLTESFCERCGTRYTFESARPKVRLKGVKVLSRGLKNFVLSDDTTMDEAMAAARSETDRESTAHQLDAFHKTFNFCMSCRQYTCPNCWNEVEARCQSCAPLPELQPAAPEVASPRFPGLTTLIGAESVAEPAPNGANGDHEDAASQLIGAEPTAKATDQTAGLLSRFRPGQSLDDELAAFEREQSTRSTELEAAVEPGTIAEPAAIAEAEAAVEAESAVELEAPVAAAAPDAAEAAAELEPVAGLEAPLEFEAADAGSESESVSVLDESGAMAAEAPFAAEDADGAAKAQESVIETSAEGPVAVEPVAAAAEPDAELASEPTLAARVEAEPVAPQADVVEQPTWRITAPDLDGQPGGRPAPPDDLVSPQPTAPSLPPAEPQWPVRPEWPAPQASAGLPFLGRPAQPQGGVESLWAASNRELVATPPTPGRTTSGIQPCISCGLSLSANARFCRRCGTLQGG